PWRDALAYACAGLETLTGIGLLLDRSLRPASRVLFPYLLGWLLLLELPAVVQAPRDAGAWGSFGEIGIMAAGAWYLFARYAGKRGARPPGFAVGASGIRAARGLLVLSLPMIGVEVMAGAIAAGDAIMQPWLQWLPHPAGWAILTGIGSIATSLALLFGIWPRLAATMEAAMLGLITLVYWVPVLQTGRTATTALIISSLVCAGVWLLSDSYRQLPWLAVGKPVWKAPGADPAQSASTAGS
ncbi:MAG TPA: hypothetical protein VFN09_04470, partial [Rhodanobacteraceae bacterium]|nr:hypothetical protein [Rhodanobacteraceae bacterium]